jgi:hypothetical protein
MKKTIYLFVGMFSLVLFASLILALTYFSFPNELVYESFAYKNNLSEDWKLGTLNGSTVGGGWMDGNSNLSSSISNPVVTGIYGCCGVNTSSYLGTWDCSDVPASVLNGTFYLDDNNTLHSGRENVYAPGADYFLCGYHIDFT